MDMHRRRTTTLPSRSCIDHHPPVSAASCPLSRRRLRQRLRIIVIITSKGEGSEVKPRLPLSYHITNSNYIHSNHKAFIQMIFHIRIRPSSKWCTSMQAPTMMITSTTMTMILTMSSPTVLPSRRKSLVRAIIVPLDRSDLLCYQPWAPWPVPSTPQQHHQTTTTTHTTVTTTTTTLFRNNSSNLPIIIMSLCDEDCREDIWSNFWGIMTPTWTVWMFRRRTTTTDPGA